MSTSQIPQVAKHILDVSSYGAIAATLLGYLPTIASVLSIIWITIQIWESKTAQHIRRKFRKSK